MHKPADQGLPVLRGDDLDFSFFVRTKDGTGTKQPVDLTGYTIDAKIVNEQGATVHTLTGTFVDASVGHCRLQLARTITATLAKYGLRWTFALISPANVRKTYIVGKVHASDPGD